MAQTLPRFRGYMLKKCAGGITGRRWVKRYFVIEGTRLEYFNVSSPEKAAANMGRGREIKLVEDLEDAVDSSLGERQRRSSYASSNPSRNLYLEGSNDPGGYVRDRPHLKLDKRFKHPFHFYLVTPDRTWQLSAESEQQKQDFILAVNSAVELSLDRASFQPPELSPPSEFTDFSDDSQDSKNQSRGEQRDFGEGHLEEEASLMLELGKVINEANRAVVDTSNMIGFDTFSVDLESEFSDCSDNNDSSQRFEKKDADVKAEASVCQARVRTEGVKIQFDGVLCTKKSIVAGTRTSLYLRLVDDKGATVPLTQLEVESLKICVKHPQAVFYPPRKDLPWKIPDSDRDAEEDDISHFTFCDEEGTPCTFSGAEFEFAVTNAGLFEIHAEHEVCLLSYPNDLPLPLKEIEVFPGAPHPKNTVLGGPGFANFPWIFKGGVDSAISPKTYFSIVTCDSYQNVCKKGGAAFDIMLSGYGILLDRIEDNGDGTYEVWYGADSLLIPKLLKRQQEGIIDFPTDISISILLDGVPLPQSPLLPTGMTAVAKSITSRKTDQMNLAVRFLMENIASSLHPFDVQKRCLIALASFPLREVQTVAGILDGKKVYTAAWRAIVERGKSDTVFTRLHSSRRSQPQEESKPSQAHTLDSAKVIKQDADTFEKPTLTHEKLVLQLPGAGKNQWNKDNSHVDRAETFSLLYERGAVKTKSMPVSNEGKITFKKKAAAWCPAHRRISLFEKPSKSHWVGGNNGGRREENVSTALLRRKEYDARLRMRREAAKRKKLLKSQTNHTVDAATKLEDQDIESKLKTVEKENRKLNQLLEESPSGSQIEKGMSTFERILEQQRAIEERHRNLFSIDDNMLD